MEPSARVGAGRPAGAAAGFFERVLVKAQTVRSSNRTTVHRSASSGQFITGAARRRNPDGTITQRV